MVFPTPLIEFMQLRVHQLRDVFARLDSSELFFSRSVGRKGAPVCSLISSVLRIVVLPLPVLADGTVSDDVDVGW